MKQWYTARELAALVLPDLPTTESAMIRRARREGWSARPRKAAGGGVEYSVGALPLEAQASLIERFIVKADFAERAAIEQPTGMVQKRLDARLIVLQQYQIYMAQLALTKQRAQFTFTMLYNARQMDGIPAWVYDVMPELSDRTLRRWLKARNEEQFSALARGKNNRTGTGHLDRGENGRIARHIGAIILAKPFLNAGHIRDLCLAEFGDVITVTHKKTGRAFETPMPDLRTFSRFIRAWKMANAEIILKLNDPDSFKNKRQISLGKADARIDRLNQQWQIDASPADILCIDGRYCIYAVIDVWSRRALFSVSRTASTEGSLALVRKAILAWGVPEAIKTDNGSDFVSHRFKQALLHLGIQQPVSTAFSPEQKGFVERVIGTMQRGLMPILPGFIGHSVADRKTIEARRAFAQRLGVDDKNALAVELKAEDLQRHLDAWADDKYGHNPHEGLNGMSPHIKAASWTGRVERIENERALDLLLAETGIRTVGKKGLTIDNANFFGRGLELMVGQQVLVRHDPQDMGRVYAFSVENHEFICEALCLDRAGVDRGEAAALAKASQKDYIREKTKDMQRAKRQITPGRIAEQYLGQAARNARKITVLPHAGNPYSTPSLDAAAKVVIRNEIRQDTPEEKIARETLAQTLQFKPKKTTKDQDDYQRWWGEAQRLLASKSRGERLDPEEESWLAMIEAHSWFKARQQTEGPAAVRAGEHPPT